MLTNVEEVYTLWHRETNLAKGRRVRTVKNFDNAKKKDNWKHFEFCANFINRNAGHVDVGLYIKSLAVHHEGWFDPKTFGSPKSIKIYKEYLKNLERESSPTIMREELIRSIKFVIGYSKKKGITDLYEYLSEDDCLIPTLLKHMSGGSVSMYFIAAVPNIITVLKSYPSDCINDYLGDDFDDKYKSYRMRLVTNDDLKKISDNLDNIFEKALK